MRYYAIAMWDDKRVDATEASSRDHAELLKAHYKAGMARRVAITRARSQEDLSRILANWVLSVY